MTEPEELEPLEPQEAVSLYKEDRRDDVRSSTLRSHGYRLDRFLNWCDEYDVTNLNNLTGRDIQRFKLWRKQQVKQVTLKSTLDTLRVFLRFCEALGAVQDGLAESVVSPTIDREQNVSDAIIETEVAETILEYQDKYNYASLKHSLFRLLWESGMRIGAAHGIDVKDVHLRDAYVELHHRPETDTPLKNGKRGERNVALSPDLTFILEDYIDEHRPDRTDSYGRKPLFASSRGRYQKTSLRVYINQMTRPCCYGKECPHDRDPDDCEAMGHRMMASKCPSSESPHAIRRGAITNFLKDDIPATVVSDRMNVTKDVLDAHYDKRTNRERMEQRRDYFDDF